MKLNYMSGVALIALLATTNSAFATGFSYFKAVTGLSGSQAKTAHGRVKEISYKLDFLNCPIELIERQWRGAESVIIGTLFLQQFIKESEDADPDYRAIEDKCLDSLNDYQAQEGKKKLRARAIVGAERQELVSSLASLASPGNEKLMELIVDNINTDTQCYTRRVAIQAGSIVSASLGLIEMDCFTPLGRRFKLRGPSIGSGIGSGAALSLPNSDRLHNPPSYRFQLYKKSERRLFHTSQINTTIACLGGTSIEYDLAGLLRGQRDAMVHTFDFRPALGFAGSTQLIHNLMTKVDQRPLFAKLAQAIDLEEMAMTSH